MSGLGCSMGNQGFLLRKLKLEGIAQKVPQGPFNLLCFRFWASKAKERVIGITHILESSEVSIVRISGRRGPRWGLTFRGWGVFPFFFRREDSFLVTLVCGFDISRFSLLVAGV